MGHHIEEADRPMAWYKMHPSECPIVFVDTETGSLNIDRAALLEVAMIKTDISGRNVTDRWECRLQPFPGDEMDPEALSINGYSAQKWLSAAQPRHAYSSMMLRARGGIIAGHNVGFDREIILRFASRFGAREWPGPHYRIDTVGLAWPLLVARLVPDLKLTTLTSFLGIHHEDAHTAMADCEAARQVYVELLSFFSPAEQNWRINQESDRAQEELMERARKERVSELERDVRDRILKEQQSREHNQITGLSRESTLPGV